MEASRQQVAGRGQQMPGEAAAAGSRSSRQQEQQAAGAGAAAAEAAAAAATAAAAASAAVASARYRQHAAGLMQWPQAIGSKQQAAHVLMFEDSSNTDSSDGAEAPGGTSQYREMIKRYKAQVAELKDKNKGMKEKRKEEKEKEKTKLNAAKVRSTQLAEKLTMTKRELQDQKSKFKAWRYRNKD